IVFCGVHFMAETADIVTDDSVRVVLPDLSAGCSMADMADYDDLVDAWEILHKTLGSSWHGRIIPITYVNSTAAVKAFVGEHGGACCTSSNADRIFAWAMAGGTQPRADGEEIKLLFLPDQHLGRNTASKYGLLTEVDARAGAGESQTALWNPKQALGGLTAETIRSATALLWAGHCSVHKLFRPEHVGQAREKFAAHGGVTVLVHPECCKEVVDLADLSGSTEYIIRAIEAAEPGSNWVIGTEVHLVNRLAGAAKQRGVNVSMLSECQCLCTTMYRIDRPHLLWSLDHIADGTIVNQIRVHPKAAEFARHALDRMLAHVGGSTTNAGHPHAT
ncbi:MAG: quinolinate synthase NadA, partial [Phycisphaerales bacterium]|nr:quinolinate synthase NadA [Phycisphaerales bacterium]